MVDESLNEDAWLKKSMVNIFSCLWDSSRRMRLVQQEEGALLRRPYGDTGQIQIGSLRYICVR